MQMEDSSIVSSRDTFLLLLRWFGDRSSKELNNVMYAYSQATKRLRQQNQQFKEQKEIKKRVKEEGGGGWREREGKAESNKE